MTTSNVTQNGAKPLLSTIIIIGAGVFGLSTALAIAKRFPSTKIIVIDRLTPPVPDGTSVDTTRCIRAGKLHRPPPLFLKLLTCADYTDPIYARLAKQAQLKIQQDAGLKPYYFQQGMTFVCDGQPSRFTNTWNIQLAAVRASAAPGAIVEMDTPEAVFRRIHGDKATPPAGTRWCKAYCNLEDAFIDAEASVRVYYERCAATPSISFKCGTPVDHINIVDGASRGVTLEDGTILDADTIIVAAGAWTNKLVNLGQRVRPTGHEVAWLKVTPEEEAMWKNMAITTNLTTGLNLFPPYQGEIKILRRSAGYTNTVTVPDPEHPSKKVEISYPRTKVSHPRDEIPEAAEAGLRENLREIMPELADRPFDRTRVCW